ncbi:MAG TPA: putative DNA binding domain-containing protein, partial [Candidatus Rifleibacterium sp.]|nr:putative DNA binding domain-containing protein [Candidatus Rifleibacterium sp.]
MMSNSEKILQLIKQGEGLELEFKEARTRLNRDVFETACAFMNRIGGTILVGVSDKGEIKGIDPQHAAQMKKDFITAINNPQKISPPAYLSVDEITLEDKLVLRIYVPESSQVHRCSSRIYDRNEDSDLDITDHTNRVATLYQRKQAIFSENKVYHFAGLKDLRADLIEKCRKMAGLWIPGHPWPQMNDLEMLQSAQLYQTDHETGKSGVTLAGILLLGQDNLILSVLPFHKTDLILRRIDLDRYDDRDIVATNLIDSYDRILAFVGKHLSDPFYLEGTNRMSLRD